MGLEEGVQLQSDYEKGGEGRRRVIASVSQPVLRLLDKFPDDHYLNRNNVREGAR